MVRGIRKSNSEVLSVRLPVALLDELEHEHEGRSRLMPPPAIASKQAILGEALRLWLDSPARKLDLDERSQGEDEDCRQTSLRIRADLMVSLRRALAELRYERARVGFGDIVATALRLWLQRGSAGEARGRITPRYSLAPRHSVSWWPGFEEAARTELLAEFGTEVTGTPGIRCVLQPHEVRETVRALGQRLRARLVECQGAAQVVCVPILTGGIRFFMDLLSHLDGVDVTIKPLWLQRERDGMESRAKVVAGPADPHREYGGHHVVIVDDVVDKGGTMTKARELVASARSVTTVAFVRKLHARHVPVDLVGRDLTTNGWLVGYGLDLAERGRTLPYVGEIVVVEPANSPQRQRNTSRHSPPPPS